MASGSGRYALRQRRSVDQFHSQCNYAVGLFQSINGCDVGMVQRGEHLRLPMESSHPFGVVYKIFGQDFQRDFAAQLCIAGTVHLTHSARADDSGNLISSEARSGREHQTRFR